MLCRLGSKVQYLFYGRLRLAGRMYFEQPWQLNLKKGNFAQSKQNLRTAGLKESRFFSEFGYVVIITVKLIIGSVVILIGMYSFLSLPS